jgi:hypothetical protein
MSQKVILFLTSAARTSNPAYKYCLTYFLTCHVHLCHVFPFLYYLLDVYWRQSTSFPHFIDPDGFWSLSSCAFDAILFLSDMYFVVILVHFYLFLWEGAMAFPKLKYCEPFPSLWINRVNHRRWNFYFSDLKCKCSVRGISSHSKTIAVLRMFDCI